MKKVYKINLRGLEVDSYKTNPVVFQSFNYNELPIGRARILPGKTRVEVEYINGIPPYPHTIGTAIIDSRQLVGLAAIPRIDL
jgi:hypothetical protein